MSTCVLAAAVILDLLMVERLLAVVINRQELEQQLHVAVLQPLHGWLRACRLNPKLALEDSSSSMPSLDNGVECEHTPQLSREFIHSAAAAIEQLLARHKTEDVAVTQQQEQQYHEHLQELQHVLEQAQVDLQVGEGCNELNGCPMLQSQFRLLCND